MWAANDFSGLVGFKGKMTFIDFHMNLATLQFANFHSSHSTPINLQTILLIRLWISNVTPDCSLRCLWEMKTGKSLTHTPLYQLFECIFHFLALPVLGHLATYTAVYSASGVGHIQFCTARAGHFRYFLIFSIIKNYVFAFFVKLITYFCTSVI